MNQPTPLSRSLLQRGQVLLLFVLMLVVLLLFVGLAIDLGFAYVTKASLSKGVDAAVLTGARNMSSLGLTQAENLARATFAANYSGKGRDAASPSVNVDFVTSSDKSTRISVSASSTIRTFFIRILPGFETLSVRANAEAVRKRLVMSLVLDRSGSMTGNDGAKQLPKAVGDFVDIFDDNNDQAAMSSFSSAAKNNVSLQSPFKSAIKTAASQLSFSGYTCSEQGLVKGMEQISNVGTQPGDNVIKALVFFTDGIANTWQYKFDCGTRNINKWRELYDPTTGNSAASGCKIPSFIPSIVPSHGNISTSQPCDMQKEAEDRAVYIAKQARAAGITVYAIGLGDPTQIGECNTPVVNPAFLHRVVNDSDSVEFDPQQPQGKMVITSAGGLSSAFKTIADEILLRLTQ